MRIGVLVSGAGTNLQALLDAEHAGTLAPAVIACVISSRPNAFALDRARNAGKPAIVVEAHQHADRDDWEALLEAELERHDAHAVVLAGFMRLLGPRFLDRFPGRVINTHPSLLPAFPGLDACGQAIAYGVKLSGCTVHFVDSGIDSGPIISQRAVAVLPTDTAATLHARIRAEEHRLLPLAVRALAAGQLVCRGRIVEMRGPVQGHMGCETQARQGGAEEPAQRTPVREQAPQATTRYCSLGAVDRKPCGIV
jgi:phosphoribosylglycinamide formyltransferase-1